MRSDFKILLLSPQPLTEIARSGLPPDIQERRFRNVLNLTDQPHRLTTCYVADQPLPKTIDADAVIISGSIHGAYENLPWIFELKNLIIKISETNIPLLGICFGHQIICQALGGKVAKAAIPEVGIVKIQLSPSFSDPLFAGMPAEFSVGARHFDEVVITPKQSTILASSQTCKVQSLAIGNYIRTVQFHPELDAPAIEFLLQRKRNEKIGGEIEAASSFATYLETVKSSPIVENGKHIVQNFVQNFIPNLS